MKHWILIATVIGWASTATATPLEDAFSASIKAEKKSDYAAAIQALEKLGPAGNTEYLVQVRLGWLHYQAKQWKESEKYYRRAEQMAPQSLEAPLGLMRTQMAAGENDDALRTGQTILSHDPNHYTAISRMAWLYYLKNDFRRSIAFYRKLTTQYPCDLEMQLGLGYALKLSGDVRSASDCFRRVLMLDPDNERAKTGLSAAPAR